MKKIIFLLSIGLPLALPVRSQSYSTQREKVLAALSLVEQWRKTDTTLLYAPLRQYSAVVIGTIVLTPDSAGFNFPKTVAPEALKIAFKPEALSVPEFDSVEVHADAQWAVSSTTFISEQSTSVVAGVCVRSLVYTYFKDLGEQVIYSSNYVESKAYALEKRFYDWFYKGNIPETDQKNYYLCSKRADEYHNLSLISAK